MFMKQAFLGGCAALSPLAARYMLFTLCNKESHQSDVRRHDLQNVCRSYWHLAAKKKETSNTFQLLLSEVKVQSYNARGRPGLAAALFADRPSPTQALRFCVLSSLRAHLCICLRLAGVYWCSPRLFTLHISISNSFSIWKSITSLLSVEARWEFGTPVPHVAQVICSDWGQKSEQHIKERLVNEVALLCFCCREFWHRKSFKVSTFVFYSRNVLLSCVSFEC